MSFFRKELLGFGTELQSAIRRNLDRRIKKYVRSLGRFDRSPNGDLTLVAMPGFRTRADAIVEMLEERKPEFRVNVVEPELGERASGEPYVRLGKDLVGDHDCVVIGSGPGTYQMRGQLEDVLGYLVGRRARRISVLLGYLPLGRSDKDERDEELALAKHSIHMLQSAAYGRLDRIMSADLHSPQLVMAADALGVITPVSFTRRVVQKALEDALEKFGHDVRICILYPDASAQQQFEEAVDKACAVVDLPRLPKVVDKSYEDVGLPAVVGFKRRINSKKSELVALVGDTHALEGAVVIAVDDEAATCGSNVSAAKRVINEHGAAHFWAVVTHGVLCGEAVQTLLAAEPKFGRMYVSDTIPVENRSELSVLVSRGILHEVSCLEDFMHMVLFHNIGKTIRTIR